MSRILIAEDEERISAFLEKGFRSAGFTVATERNGNAALDEARTGEYDLVILDVGLPDRDGFEILETLRSEGNQVAIIMLTSRDSGADIVRGLEGGANDYLSKPFRFDELLARVRLRLKDSRVDQVDVLEAGGIALNLKTRRISVEGSEFDLSAREFALAEEFLRHPEQVLSREQLLSRIWGMNFDPGSNVVEVYVRYLRGKVGAARIETVRGMGYRLRNAPHEKSRGMA